MVVFLWESGSAGQREMLPYLLRLNRFGKALLADIGLSYLVHIRSARAVAPRKKNFSP